MAITYNYEIETDLSPKQLLEIGAEVCDAKIDNGKPLNFRITGVFATSIKTKDIDLGDYGKNKYIQGYGFLPDITLTFEQYLYEDAELSQQKIAKLVIALFKQTKGKAIFLFDYDKTIAQRLNGDIIEIHIEGDGNHPDYYDWLVKECDKVGLKYKRDFLTSPLQM